MIGVNTSLPCSTFRRKCSTKSATPQILTRFNSTIVCVLLDQQHSRRNINCNATNHYQVASVEILIVCSHLPNSKIFLTAPHTTTRRLSQAGARLLYTLFRHYLHQAWRKDFNLQTECSKYLSGESGTSRDPSKFVSQPGWWRPAAMSESICRRIFATPSRRAWLVLLNTFLSPISWYVRVGLSYSRNLPPNLRIAATMP